MNHSTKLRSFTLLFAGCALLLQQTPAKADEHTEPQPFSVVGDACDRLPINGSQNLGIFTLVRVDLDYTCNGKWPGGNSCAFTNPDARSVVADTVKANRTTGDGLIVGSGYDATNRAIFLTVAVGEGDVFNPGKHTSSFHLWYCVLQ